MDLNQDPRLIIQTLDLSNTDVVRSLVTVFGPRLAALLTELEDPPTTPTGLFQRLTDLFTAIIAEHERFDPAQDSGVEAWLYRQALRWLMAEQPRSRRPAFRRRAVQALAGAHHGLEPVDIASALNMREGDVLQRVKQNNAPDSKSRSLTEVDFERLCAAVLENLPVTVKIQPRSEPRSGPLREAAWVVAGLLLILALIITFNNSNQAEHGVILFPEATAQLPDPIGAADAVVRTVPSPINDTGEDYFLNLQSTITPDGRFIVFASNQPNLVPDDDNSAFDIFLFDAETGQRSRVSLDEASEEFYGDSTNPGISSDGRWVVFSTFSFSEGGYNIYLRDLANQETRQIDFLPNGTDPEEAHFPAISGDGSTVVFWINARTTGSSGCSTDEEDICADLVVYERASGIATQVPIGNPVFTWLNSPSISDDGTLVAITIAPLSSWGRPLDSPNETEAVILNWRSQSYIPLNLTPEGNYGNQGSEAGVISGNGRYAAFTSFASDLVAGDTNDQYDAFISDLTTGEVKRINLTPEGGEQALGGAQTDVLSDWGDNLAISDNGRYVYFSSSAPNMLKNMDWVSCGELPEGDTRFQCFGSFLYDREMERTEQINLGGILQTYPQSLLMLFPAISESGNRFVFTVGTWQFEPPCPPEGCFSIWLLDADSRSATLASKPQTLITEGVPVETWAYTGSIPAPKGWSNEVAVAPSGEWLAVAGQSGSAITADTETGTRILNLLGQTGDVNTVAISPDEHWLATGSADGSVLVWNAETGTQEFGLYDHAGIVYDAAFSPDGDRLAVGSQQALWIWTYSGREFVLTGSFTQSFVKAVAFSPDGQWIAASSNSEVWIRRVTDGEIVARLDAHTGRILDLAFSPIQEGSYTLATAGQDDQAILWSVAPKGDGLEIDYLITLMHNDWVSAIAFSPDGGILATGSFDNAIYLWELPGGKYLQTLKRTTQDQVLSLAFSPSGDKLFSSTVRGIRAWHAGSDFVPITPDSIYFVLNSQNEFVEVRPYFSNWFTNLSITPMIYSDYRILDTPSMSAYRVPANLPDNFTFQALATYHLKEEEEMVGLAQTFIVTTNFKRATLTLVQSTEDPRLTDWPIGSSASIITTEVNGYEAEAAFGGWGLGDDQLDGTSVRIWNPEAASLWLRWQDEDFFYTIFYDQPYNLGSVPENERVAMDDLIYLAESLYSQDD